MAAAETTAEPILSYAELVSFSQFVLATMTANILSRKQCEVMLSHPNAKDIVSKFLLATSVLLYEPRNVFPTVHSWIFLLLHAPHSAGIKAQLDNALLCFGKDTVARLRSRIRDDPPLTMLADLLATAHNTVLSEPIAAGAGTLGVLAHAQSLLTSGHVSGLIDTLRYCSQNDDDVAMDIVRSEIIVALRRRPDADTMVVPIFQLAIRCFVQISQNASSISYLTPDRVLLLRQLESQMRPEFEFLRPFLLLEELT